MVKCVYRISDGSYKKNRLPNATKENCLANFLKEFEDVTLIADNVSDETYKRLETTSPPWVKIVRTNSKGNGFSFNYALDYALENFPNEYVYFVEDDYLHRKNSQKVLLEGLHRADYVSLYDHVDKYIPKQNGGNPFIDTDGGELTRVYITESTHWKLTNSTTCTFATHASKLAEDIDVWRQFTNHMHPNDFHCFLNLREKGRSLITPLPSYSTHCDIEWVAPLVDWSEL
ncbi:MAG: hypothetical protein VW683_01330 [Betaproteobacteria bacterium]|jgi:hypothetical protein